MGGRRGLPPGLSRVVRGQAASIVARLLRADGERRGGASIKTLTLAPGLAAKKATHAVVCETLKHVPILEAVLEEAGVAIVDDDRAELGAGRSSDASPSPSGSGFSADDVDASAAPPLARSVAYVLAYECLFGAGLETADASAGRGDPAASSSRASSSSSSSSIASATARVESLAPSLRDSLRRVLRREKRATAEAFLRARPGGADAFAAPARSRHARVNPLRDGFTVERALASNALKRLGCEITPDPHVPNLLTFPPGTDLHAHAFVADGRLVLQGKASCLPCAALEPEPGWEVVDCCAAPGNKTTQLAACVGLEGVVHAFDADAKRLARLEAFARRAGAGAVVRARRADFLALDASAPEFRKVRAVLLDPSCSGSGTSATRGDGLVRFARAAFEAAGTRGAPKSEGDVFVKDEDATRSRVERLAEFQRKALRVALSFPAAERVVYSTCSVHAEENERVVAAVMPAARELGYELAAAIPSWPRRGWEGEGLEREDAAKVVRADPAQDDCEGFFVALFSRPTRVRELERAEEEEREEARRKGGTLSPGGARKRPREEGGKASRGEDVVRAVKFAAKKKRGKRPGGPLFR